MIYAAPILTTLKPCSFLNPMQALQVHTRLAIDSQPSAVSKAGKPAVVSLGSCCAVKESIKHGGWSAESLPFDWMKTRIEGIIRYLTKDFEGFFDVTTKQVVPGTGGAMVMFRDYYHSFWHDNLEDQADLEKYKRRIHRFMSLFSSGRPILFVRAIAESDEIQKIPDLLQAATRFGPHVRLLVILHDYNKKHPGPCRVVTMPNLLVYFHDVHSSLGDQAPFVKAIDLALLWASGVEITSNWVNSIRQIEAMVDNMSPIIVHGLSAFEAAPPSKKVDPVVRQGHLMAMSEAQSLAYWSLPVY